MGNKAKIYISGGGDEKQSFELDRLFVADLIDRGGKVLYIPIALERDRVGFKKARVWFKGMLSLHTKKKIYIDMWLNEKKISNLSNYSGVYVGGGNTYKLLYILKESGMDKLLLKYLKDGGLLYGGSAGAIITGKSITTVKEEQTDKKYKLDKGLNLFDGLSFRCHYRNSQKTTLMKKFEENKTGKTLTLTEESGLVLENSEIRLVGSFAKYFIGSKLQKTFYKNSVVKL